MAKGSRSHTRAKNHAKLRATVFGPVIDERTKRLSAKLQEISSQPLSKDADMADADFNIIDKSTKDSEEVQKKMDIDEQPDTAKPTSEGNGGGRIQKRSRRKKRPAITFKPHPGKLRRMAKKK